MFTDLLIELPVDLNCLGIITLMAGITPPSKCAIVRLDSNQTADYATLQRQLLLLRLGTLWRKDSCISEDYVCEGATT
jgi:hypothetical protein